MQPYYIRLLKLQERVHFEQQDSQLKQLLPVLELVFILPGGLL